MASTKVKLFLLQFGNYVCLLLKVCSEELY